jgi:hypothetical protein
MEEAGTLSKNNQPRIICFVPALPNEIRLNTLHSIASQSIPVSAICLLTKFAPKTLAFPAKISYIVNEWLATVRLEDYDYLLRVDADTVLPANFIEGNLTGDFDVVGYGPAQLIKVSSFIKVMGGRMHPDHDDGYPLVKFKQAGLKAQSTYFVEPVIQRQPGFHQGATYFVGQGELHYRYGYDPVGELLVVFGKYKRYHPFGVFYLVGYFKALLTHKSRFDVAGPILSAGLLKYRNPSRFFKSNKVKMRIIRGINFE